MPRRVPGTKFSVPPFDVRTAPVKKVIAIAGAVALSPTLLIAPVAVAVAGSNSAQSSCSADGTQAVDSAAVAKQVKSILKGDGKGSVSVFGVG